MVRIDINDKGQKVVIIDEIIFSCKRKINWGGVEQFLKQYVGKGYSISETDDVIYIGSEFPDEYANSKYSHKIYGWYRCTIRFSLPICNDKGTIIGRNSYQGRMIIRHDSNGKKYLYDIVDIKKET